MAFSTIRTRIAPSPTGIAHVGTLFMALFNYAFAKQQNGEFIVRVEDTDRQRFVEGAEQVVFDCLRWANIVPDESPEVGGPFAPYRQSERLPIYQQYAQQLIEAGHAYYCFATAAELQAMREAQQKQGLPPKYDGRYRDFPLDKAKERIAHGESYVIRMRVPAGKTKWHDLIRGEVEIDHAQIDDQVLMKSDGFPTYHLAVVVDDHLMQISHVIRGEEWISSTPKHILLYQMLGWEQPSFAHMPLLRNPDHSKLSKRKNDVSIVSYRDKGYLAEALVNFLMLLGWSHPEGQEFISLPEFVQDFTIDRMQKTGPVFDLDKLNWMNGKYIREQLSESQLIDRLQPFLPEDYPRERISEFMPLVRERLVTLRDFVPLTEFFYHEVNHDPALLLKKATPELVKDQLQQTIAVLESVTDWQEATLETAVRALQEKLEWKKSQYFMLIRVAVTGQIATPPLFSTMQVLGRNQCLERLQRALAIV
jgi:glutamyl-tRNA synthetase